MDIKRENAEHGLQVCHGQYLHHYCSQCPYTMDIPTCIQRLHRDALALLKAQEPRVMALEEVKSAWRNRNIAFLVEYNDGGNPVWMLYYGYLSTLEEIVLIDEIAHLRHFGVDGYGVDWRCWTSRPTDEQRRNEPWRG